MPNMSEYVAALASEIGPRPAGTEEEQNAALYIEEELKKATSLPTQVEEFDGATGNTMTRLICAGVAVVAGLMFMITAALAIPALVLGLAAVVVFVADFLGKPLIARLFSKGVSQNVVAKYVPAGQQSGKGRKRKVIIVTRYDSGKVRPELKKPFVGVLGIANRVSAAAIPFIFVWMLFRSIFFMYPEGVLAIVLNVILGLAMLAAALPLILRGLAQTSSYNDGANSSASGVAVMMEVAKRVAEGESYVPDQEEPVVIHDAEAAEEAGVVPDGAEVVYAVAPTDFVDEPLYDDVQDEYTYDPEPQPDFEEEDLGDTIAMQPIVIGAQDDFQPVSQVEPQADFEEELEPQAEQVVAFEPEPQPEPEPEPAVSVFVPSETPVVEVLPTAAVASNVPDWFKSGQAKAKKSADPAPNADYRSRYAVAYDAMQAEREAAQLAAQQAALEQEAAERAAAIEAVRLAAAQAEAERKAAQQARLEQEAEMAAEEIAQEAEISDDVLAEAPAVEEVQPEVAEEAVERVHDGSNADMLTEMLNEGREAIPQVKDLEMPEFLFTAQAGGLAAAEPEQPESQPEPEPEPQPVVEEYVENVADFVGAQEDFISAEATSKMPVILPDIESGLAPIEEIQQQRAPLADGAVAEDGSVAAKGLLNMLPSIDAAPAEPASGRPALNLPSLSGAFAPVSAPAGSAGMTGSFAPVGDQLVATAEDPEDMFIDDVDESDFEENFTETGAYAGPDYVEMPKSRFGDFFGGLFKKKDKPSRKRASKAPVTSTSEWLDVDEDFDARTVGAARGDWSSFQEGSEWENGATTAFDPVSDQGYDDGYGDGYDDGYEDGYEDDYGYDYDDDRRWEGGAFSAVKDRVAGAASGAAGAVKGRLPFGGGAQEEQPERTRSRRGSQETERPERAQRVRGERKDPFGGLGLNFTEDPQAYAFEEDQKIEQFQNPGIKTEVWFVALGADMDGNAGMRAFLDTHASELRGAMILELEAVGAGELSLVGTEGSLKPIKGSSRMKRYIRKAGQALGVSLPTVELPWNDSASACATAHGCQALHLAGIEDGSIALLGQADDVAENVDEEAMLLAADYVMEVIRAV